jgi:hypothetical protein
MGSLALTVGLNLLCFALILYLLAPQVRQVFFNPRVRWWETAPRFYVSLATHVGQTPCTILDLAEGGAGIELTRADYKMNDVFNLDFKYNDKEYSLPSVVVYTREFDGKYRYGIKWTDPQSSKTLKPLMKYFKAQGFSETRQVPPWREDLKSWWSQAKSSKSAWLPQQLNKKT